MTKKLKTAIVGGIIALVVAIAVSYGLISQQTADDIKTKTDEALSSEETVQQPAPEPQPPATQTAPADQAPSAPPADAPAPTDQAPSAPPADAPAPAEEPQPSTETAPQEPTVPPAQPAD